MSDGPYKVHTLTPEETEAFIKERRGTASGPFGKTVSALHKSIICNGFEVKGRFELTARNVHTGDVEWEHEQDNLITDAGRVAFFDTGWTNMTLGFAPSRETPAVNRYSLPTDGTQCVQVSPVNLGSGTVTPSTYTKQFSCTFGVPPSNRTLGTIWTAYYAITSLDGNLGPISMWSYALLTPPKTQTTTQTIEVVYKISMNPIF